MPLKAVTIGGAMVDTIAIVDDALIERMSMSNAGKTFLLLEQGSKTEASSISTHCGGGAVNSAIALARLGFAVSIIAKVGADERAEIVRQALIAEGIASTGIVTADAAPTGASAIVSAHDRNAAIFTFRGANTTLCEADIADELFDADLVYVSALSGASADVLPHAVRLGGCRGKMIAVNPGLRQITTRFMALRDVFPDVGILALNRIEAEALVRQAVAELAGIENAVLRRIAADTLIMPDAMPRTPRSVTAHALIDGLRHLGARTVLLTDGKHGAYLGHENETFFCPALDVDVISSAGAGDAFVSTFAGIFTSTRDIEHALLAATINASAVVTAADSQSGLLKLGELEDRIETVRRTLSISKVISS